MALTTESLARASSKRPWVTIGIWVAFIALAGVISSQLLAGSLTTDAEFTNKPEAVRASELIEDRLRGPEGVTEIFILSSPGQTVDDTSFAAAVRDFQQKAASTDHVMRAVSFYDEQDPSLVSADGSTTLVPVTFDEPERNVSEHLPEVEGLTNYAGDRLSAQSFGPVSLDEDFSTTAEEDLRKGEGIGLFVAVVVLVIVFGAFVAPVLPISMGIASIAVALGITALVGQLWDFSFFVTNMITMMGLAVGIDYSLFIVSRYREEREHGLEKLDAIGIAGATAGRAVFFSGLTVVFALLGMLIIPTTIFRSLAAGSIFVVVVAVLASMTLLPALLGLLGDRINAGQRFLRRKRETGATRHGFWDRVTHGVMGRPVLSLVLGVGILLAAASSYLDINTGFAGVSTLPDDAPSKRAFGVLASEFSGGLNSPLEVVVDADASSPAVQSGVEAFQTSLAGDPMFGAPNVEVNDTGDMALISAALNADPSSDAAVQAIERVRETYVPRAFSDASDVLVGGQTAFYKDFFDLTDDYTPIVFAFVLGLSFVLLTIVFRSLVVPVKAIILNLLSVGAAYGLVVLVMQKGVGAEFFGFQQVEAIEAWLPLFLFSVLFGLSMDYHVFLLSRIRERFDHTHDNAGSVAYGLRTTAGLITGAALIMVAVFGGFATGDLVSMQQMGFGLAVAVFIDATLVRSVLVPASMKLLGDRNWYLPRWLQWLPHMNIEGSAAVAAGTPSEAADAAPERELVPEKA